MDEIKNETTKIGLTYDEYDAAEERMERIPDPRSAYWPTEDEIADLFARVPEKKAIFFLVWLAEHNPEPKDDREKAKFKEERKRLRAFLSEKIDFRDGN